MGEWKLRSSEPEQDETVLRLLGVNDANPTKEVGRGVVVTRTAEGVYKITWNDNPGTFVGIAGYCFGAATPADVKGYTISSDTYDSTTFSLEVSVWNSSFAAADIIATQFLNLTVRFKQTGLAI